MPPRSTWSERQRNEERVLSTLRDEPLLSRRTIAERAGVSYPTVTKILADLVGSQVVDELDHIYQGFGRPGKLYRLAAQSRFVAGLVVGTRSCELVLAGCDGRIHEQTQQRFKTPARFSTLVRLVAQRLAKLEQELDGTLLGLGVTIPGLVDTATGKVLTSPNVKQLQGRTVAVDLQKELSFPVTAVPCMHGLFLAERLFGRVRQCDDFILLNYVGGLGTAICSGGNLLTGAHGMAGELGHITVDNNGPACACGNRGCLETKCTDRVIEDVVSIRLGKNLTFDQIVAADRLEALPIDDLLDEAVDYLAIGVATAINLFDPQAVFLYGRFLHLRPSLADRLRSQVTQRSISSLKHCRLHLVADRVQELERAGAVATIIRHLTTHPPAVADRERTASP